MSSVLENELAQLARTLGEDPRVRAVGLSAGDRPLPEPGQGDLDLFIYTTHIPTETERRERIAGYQGLRMGLSSGGPWGTADVLELAGVETWLMYFTVADANRELDEILAGNFLDRLDAEYYPIGRAAMYRHMRTLYDPDGVIAGLKTRVAVYPEELAAKMLAYHLHALEDTEDLDRAVQLNDLLFYHHALDRALDHFLLALFAINREFFPSRKRSLTYLAGFSRQPRACADRLLKIVSRAGEPECLRDAQSGWESLIEDLFNLL